MYVDFDSFFCVVFLKKYQELIDKLIVIVYSDGFGFEIVSCNYLVRVFGVKNGMWMKCVQEMCFDFKVLLYDFLVYEDVSWLFYEVIFDVGGIV